MVFNRCGVQVQAFGSPDKIETLTKRNKTIFGPPETYWDKLAIGESVEIWSYQQKDGTRQFHFLRDSDVIDYTTFTPKGVVYESE